MPNWRHCRWTVSGPAPTLARFRSDRSRHAIAGPWRLESRPVAPGGGRVWGRLAYAFRSA